MKQTENNEIDLLLRGLARREGVRSVAPEDSTTHLDADELNSYAAQALPAAARARYTSHLAECATCRKIVSELTSSSGTNVSQPSVPQKTSGLLQKFGALFSPGALRYAVPALALFAFIAIGLVALRQQPPPDFVAQNQPAASRDPTSETKQADSPAEPGTAAIEDRRSSESQSDAGKVKNNQAKTDKKSESSNVATAADSVTVTSDKDASAGKAAGVVASPSYASESAAPPPPKPQTTHTEARTEVAARQKEETDKKRDEPAREQEGARARTDDSQNEVTAASARKAGRPAGQSEERLRTPGVTLSGGAGAKTNDDEANIRTVSGRRFRRQGGVWIDTAYQSSSSTTNLVRGSEQFRALVEDEPGIRSIAAQLPGEVVVVWKGRAYRIR